MVSDFPSGSVLCSALTSSNDAPVSVSPLQRKENSRAGLRAGFSEEMNSVWVARSVRRWVTSPDEESKVMLRSIWLLPMVQLWQSAHEAESHHTTAANVLILIRECSPMFHGLFCIRARL